MSVSAPAVGPRSLAFWVTEDVPEGADYAGVLRTLRASPVNTILGVLIGLGSFLTITPLVTQLLAVGYWLAIGRPGAFADTYQALVAFQLPFGMAAAQLGIALLIPLSLALVITIHHVRPSYLFSVRPGLRWRAFWAFLLAALVTINGVVWLQNAVAGKQPLVGPQPGFLGFMLAVALTSPLQAAAEEVFFRGYLLQALGALSSGRWLGIVASAAVFALFHGVQNPWLFASRFAFGVLAAVLVVYIGGLEASIAAHIVNNVCAFVYAGLSTGVATLRATTETTPVEAAWEIGMYLAFTLVALGVARALRPQTRVGASGLGDAATVR